jgi:hypothetical protein
MIKEILVDAAIVIFIGLLSAGSKHLHDGACHEGHNGQAYASGSKTPK